MCSFHPPRPPGGHLQTVSLLLRVVWAQVRMLSPVCLGVSVPGATPHQRNRAAWSILACLSHKGTQLMFFQRVPSRTEPHLPTAGIYQLSGALFLALGLKKKKKHWSIVDLQFCVNFCCIAKWLHVHIYILIYCFSFMVYSRIYEYTPLCYTVRPSSPFILYVRVYIY